MCVHTNKEAWVRVFVASLRACVCACVHVRAYVRACAHAHMQNLYDAHNVGSLPCACMHACCGALMIGCVWNVSDDPDVQDVYNECNGCAFAPACVRAGYACVMCLAFVMYVMCSAVRCGVLR